MKSCEKKQEVLLVITFVLVLFVSVAPLPAQEADAVPSKEDTYSISLVKTEEVEKEQEVYQVEDKKVLAETVTVVEGDHLWQIFRERGLLKKRDFPVLLEILKNLNKALTNLDLIYPGDKIIIPLTLLPVTAQAKKSRSSPPEKISPEELDRIKFEYYTVKPGDSLVKVVKSRYHIPPDTLRHEYLDLVRRLNPAIEDLNLIHPGQVIRLPIYSPQIVRMPIAEQTPSETEPTAEQKNLLTLSRELAEIFGLMGEEWVQSGEHFIPLKSGGQVNLKAASYPILNLNNGNRIIIDLFHLLPQKMVELITSNWRNYRVVQLEKGEDLNTALGKILPLCGYPKIYPPGQPLHIKGDIEIEITGDWIVETTPGDDKKGVIAVISILGEQGSPTPREILDYIEKDGVKVIEFPRPEMEKTVPWVSGESLQPVFNKADLIERIFRLSDRDFTRNVEIPVYQSQKTNFSLIIKADFLFQDDGIDCIIDLTGLDPPILSLLREHQFKVMSLSDVEDPTLVASETLEFIGVEAESKVHTFTAAERNTEKNIRLSIPGILFRGSGGQIVFATEVNLPEEIALFLKRKGYGLLGLSFS
ncbi:MAG: LysM peptidoglycan-binding domain-containing protein [Deltaproteobacteria bacterium]|nr:LysM peptidoglycan-binding domain-containing protein [Deltaproteobacteria bacterium]